MRWREPIGEDDADREAFVSLLEYLNGFTGEETRRHGEETAERLVEAGLSALEIEEEDLETMKKGDLRKAILARAVRGRTTVSAAWIASRLSMGVPSRVSHSQRELTIGEREDRKTKAMAKQIERILTRFIA